MVEFNLKEVLMNTFIVTYVLHTPGQKYTQIEKYMNDNLECKKIMNTTWLISSTHSAKIIRDAIETFLDDNDALFVAKLHSPKEISKKFLNNGSTPWIEANM